MSQATYTVTGMTCGHCADAVTSEITTLAGVQTVAVDVESGQVTVISDTPLLIDDRSESTRLNSSHYSRSRMPSSA